MMTTSLVSCFHLSLILHHGSAFRDALPSTRLIRYSGPYRPSTFCSEAFNPRVYYYGHTILSNSINGDQPPTTNQFDDAQPEAESQIGDFSCRIVALADGKIPSNETLLPDFLRENERLVTQLDSIYNSISRTETRRLSNTDNSCFFNETQDAKLMPVLRDSLEDAGFELLTKRDLDLCEALNAGYLLRLSMVPNTKELDPSIGREFYPEFYTQNQTITDDDLLFDGRILLFRRGYSSETSKGKLLLLKLDYLQASLIQKSASKLAEGLGQFERKLLLFITRNIRRTSARLTEFLANIAELLPSKPLSGFLKNRWGWNNATLKEIEQQQLANATNQQNLFFKLGRYGGSKIKFVGSPDISDALTPFLVCEVNEGLDFEDNNLQLDESSYNGDVDHDIMEALNKGDLTCQYDSENPSYRWRRGNPIPPALLERVTLKNVVDLYSKEGRKRVVRGFISESELVEPTFEEVIAIWRPLPKKPKRVIVPPKILYDVAEIFDMEERLPKKPESVTDPDPCRWEIRTFEDVPMANLPAVFPKTRLVLRPADAFLFDLSSVFTFLIVLGSQRFDNPKLDLIALVSVTFWIFRTSIRYSNKLARYDLLVKNFLSSKISHRDQGAVKYILDEAGSQRALRVALLYLWVLHESQKRKITRIDVLNHGFEGMNKLLKTNRLVDFDVEAGLNDLEDLGLAKFAKGTEVIDYIVKEDEASSKLKETWDGVFDGKVSLRSLVNRRKRQIIYHDH